MLTPRKMSAFISR
jgi:hypothetical protein